MRTAAGICLAGIAVIGAIEVVFYEGLTQKIVGLALIVVGVGGAAYFFASALRSSRANKSSDPDE
ncbi:hypothetical protein [Parafrigoribacterium soli]|uniref:hypothetical protein n=1 Tax=Parafrigoribacterium soli TaxID=3144663 RepID=UPI0032EED4D7